MSRHINNSAVIDWIERRYFVEYDRPDSKVTITRAAGAVALLSESFYLVTGGDINVKSATAVTFIGFGYSWCKTGSITGFSRISNFGDPG